MSRNFLVRVGAMGAVGRFRSADGSVHARGARVVCRTRRGLEIGELLAEAGETGGGTESTDGEVLRRMSVEDELLAARLERFQHEAYQACVDLLDRQGVVAPLMDVELLFDGGSLYFYFLGETDGLAASVTEALARTYNMTAQIERFQETLVNGCGPFCGTENAAGCGDGGCATCAISSACKKP